MPGGDGFLFEDGNDGASSLREMQRLILKAAHNADRIAPFLSGDDILEHPQHKHSRYIVDFYGVSDDRLGDWPDLTMLLREKVSKEREGTRLSELQWWCHERSRPALRTALVGLRYVFVHPFTSSYLAFARVPATTIVATPHCVFASEKFALFCVLQSRLHELWVKMTASTLEDRLRYAPSDCFETFPFPHEWKENEVLEQVGEEYYQFRAELMSRNAEGLTTTYNRFHNKYEENSEIKRLRDLHAQMDRAVLDAYGWTDLQPVHDFILEYVEEEDEEAGGRRKRKEPWRYRWVDEDHDEVLARLLELNRIRAEEEAQSAASNQPAKPAATRTRKSAKQAPPIAQRTLYQDPTE